MAPYLVGYHDTGKRRLPQVGRRRLSSTTGVARYRETDAVRRVSGGKTKILVKEGTKEFKAWVLFPCRDSDFADFAFIAQILGR